MKRLVDDVLDAWARDSRRLPLLIRGARQVGKTYAVTALGERRFSDVASINLEQQPRYRRCFDTLEPRAILDQVGILRGTPVEPGRGCALRSAASNPCSCFHCRSRSSCRRPVRNPRCKLREHLPPP